MGSAQEVAALSGLDIAIQMLTADKKCQKCGMEWKIVEFAGGRGPDRLQAGFCDFVNGGSPGLVFAVPRRLDRPSTSAR